MTPPAALTEVAGRVDTHLADLLDAEHDRWCEVDPRLAEAVDELRRIVTSGGKRLRAAFCYWSWRGAYPDADDDRPALDAAAACELLQAFALIHDDVMDDAATRRGVPTVHALLADRAVARGWRGEPRRFGEGVAILVGDLGHVYADRLMGGASGAARAIWDELRIELNLGQYLDLRAAAAGDHDPATATRVALFKSALYTIVRPLQLGASLHGPADPELLDVLERAGRPLGRAFQLRDDLLGVTGDPTRLGKPVGADLTEGKPTELLAAGLERARGADRERLARLGGPDGDRDPAPSIEVLRRVGAVDHIESIIADLAATSVSGLSQLGYEPAVRGALVDLAHYVSFREV